MPTGALPRVLVVDDDAGTRTLVTWQLESEGFEVREAGDGLAAMAAITTEQPDLVVLDLGLPGLAGLDVLTRLRRTSSLPVIVVTGRSGETDRIVGLDLGADDYMVKPFSPGELAARVRSVLRRSRGAGGAARPTGPAGEEPQAAGPRLTVDTMAREVTVDGRHVELTAREFDLLAFLVASPRRVLTRAQLLERVWHSSPDWQEEATVTQHMHRLRRKVEPDPDNPRWLRTVRGVGYQFEP
jgi:DNA-binding response OmpR family regulator